MKTEEEYRKELGEQIKRYLKKSGLNIKDFAKLIKSNTTNVESITAGQVGVTVVKLIAIANLFGVAYYNLANPTYPIPSKSELTKNIKNVIENRKIIGDKSIDNKRILSKELDKLISEGHANTPTTSKILHNKMDHRLSERKTSEITSLLGNSPRKESIIPLKHSYNKQKIYIHKKYIHEYSSLTKEELAILILKKEEELRLVKKDEG